MSNTQEAKLLLTIETLRSNLLKKDKIIFELQDDIDNMSYEINHLEMELENEHR